MANKNNFKDLTGQVFHRLTVIKYVGSSHYLCFCECGNYRKIDGRNLKKGQVSCGCYNKEKDFIDLTDKVYGELTVKHRAESNKGHTRWFCECSCGNKVIVHGSHLSTGHTKSCGCKNKHGLSGKPGYNAYLMQNPIRKIKSLVSRSVYRTLKSKNINKAGRKTFDHLPYTAEELKEHLKSLFEPWMNWNNWGKYRKETWDDNDQSTWKWQIDHIIPVVSFKFTSMTSPEFLACWDLTNLRPLSAKENVRRKRKLE